MGRHIQAIGRMTNSMAKVVKRGKTELYLKVNINLKSIFLFYIFKKAWIW